MKLTRRLVKQFEEDQKQHGTETAMFNLLWLQAKEILNGIGVKNLHTRTWPRKTSRRK